MRIAKSYFVYSSTKINDLSTSFQKTFNSSYPCTHMQAFVIIVVILGLGSWYYLGQPIFGKLPEGKRLERVQASPNYKGGKFVNQEHTPDFAEGVGMFDAAKSFLHKPDNTEPKGKVPSVRTDLKNLDPNKPQLIWFGHSSYLLKVDGLTMLVDPVFSGNASPVNMFAKAFDGSNVYGVNEMPFIDVLLLTHDHYDHLDYKTILALKGKFGKIVTSLGVGAHLNHWGIPDEQMVELDWTQNTTLKEGFVITAMPARHFSGRLFTRAQSLWSSFVYQTPHHKLYLGADSGYGKHFKEIGEQFGPFDLALLECGQYNDMWPYIHMKPEEVVTAAKDLKSKVLMPVHWGKFSLAMHPWNEPIQRVSVAAKENGMAITTPLIGEPVVIGGHYPDSIWWNFE